MTQSAASQQIRKLEEDMRLVLLLRHRRGVELSQSGMRFHQRIAVVMKTLDEIIDDIG